MDIDEELIEFTEGLINVSRSKNIGEWLENIAENYRKIRSYGYADVLEDLTNMLVEERIIFPEDKSYLWMMLDKRLHIETNYDNPHILKEALEDVLSKLKTCFYDEKGDLWCYRLKPKPR